MPRRSSTRTPRVTSLRNQKQRLNICGDCWIPTTCSCQDLKLLTLLDLKTGSPGEARTPPGRADESAEMDGSETRAPHPTHTWIPQPESGSHQLETREIGSCVDKTFHSLFQSAGKWEKIFCIFGAWQQPTPKVPPGSNLRSTATLPHVLRL